MRLIRARATPASGPRRRILINAGGICSGGGLTYVLALAEELRRGGDRGLSWTLLVHPEVAARVGDPASGARVQVVVQPTPRPLLRAGWEQAVLPWHLFRWQWDVVVNAGNFAPLLAPKSRNILLAQNALYFAEHPWPAGVPGMRLRVERLLARASVQRSRHIIVASDAMAAYVLAGTGKHATVCRFGPGLAREHRRTGERFVFLHRTRWGPHKRLDELLLAVRQLARTHRGRFLLRSACDPFSRFARRFSQSAVERALLEDRDIAQHVEIAEFPTGGEEPIEGDAVVIPSIVESFCFPLAEGLAERLPVVVADSALAREMCGESAVFVVPGDATALADGMRRVLNQTCELPPWDRTLLSWSRHVAQLAGVCEAAAAEAPIDPLGGPGRRR
jgi:glycosyltransferase involved in cell wall biosynthesis